MTFAEAFARAKQLASVTNDTIKLEVQAWHGPELNSFSWCLWSSRLEKSFEGMSPEIALAAYAAAIAGGPMTDSQAIAAVGTVEMP